MATSLNNGAQDLVGAYRRLSAAYERSQRYAADVRRLYRQVQRQIHQSLIGLASALEDRDPCFCGHSARVGATSQRIALALGLGDEEVEIVSHAGLLHDIGTIGVPEAILRKAGALDAAEVAVMRRHPILGAQIVAPFEFFASGALMIRHHHERLDGSGYPDGLRGSAIPVGARIVAVADAYDALTSARAYRGPWTPEQAIAHLVEGAGRAFDEDVVAAMVGLTTIAG
jgi:HD-GYP domain-containing protein (c-di-GMP phosphodiesterase class II)